MPVDDRVRVAAAFEARAADRRVDGVGGGLLGVEEPMWRRLPVASVYCAPSTVASACPSSRPRAQFAAGRRRRSGRARCDVRARRPFDRNGAPVASTGFVFVVEGADMVVRRPRPGALSESH